MWWTVIAAALAAAPPTVDEPLRTGRAAPGDAAVVIGLEDYLLLPDVPFAVRDAEAFHDFLVYTRGVPADRVRLLRGGAKEQLVAAVESAAASVTDEGLLWIYFAGHGAAGGQGGRILLGDDARQDPAAFEARALSLERIEDLVGSVDTVVVLDTCFSGSARDGSALAPGKRFAVPAAFRTPQPTTTVWTATSPGEFSGPYDPARHGAFTYLAVGALRGWADGELDGERDGIVALGEAQAYVARTLRTLQEHSQTPVLHGDGGLEASFGDETAPPAEAFGNATPTSAEASGDGYLAQLEAQAAEQRSAELERTALEDQLAQLERKRRDLVKKRHHELESQAAAEWERVRELLSKGPVGDKAIRAFLDKWDSYSEDIEGQPEAFSLATVAAAKAERTARSGPSVHDVRDMSEPQLAAGCRSGGMFACTEQICRNKAFTKESPQACECLNALRGGWTIYDDPEEGMASACSYLGVMLANQWSHLDEPEDLLRPHLAKQWFQYTCDRFEAGCYQLGEMVYPDSPTAAERLFRIGIEGNSDRLRADCLGDKYLPESCTVALEWYRAACSEPDGEERCYKLGILETKLDPEAAAATFRRALQDPDQRKRAKKDCKKGKQASCDALEAYRDR